MLEARARIMASYSNTPAALIPIREAAAHFVSVYGSVPGLWLL